MDPISEYFNSRSQLIKSNNLQTIELINKCKINDFLHEKILTLDKNKQKIWGQFHTPKIFQSLVVKSLPTNIVKLLASGQKLIDPACGTGNFLQAIISISLNYFSTKTTSKSSKFDLVNEFIIPNICGAEIDETLIYATKKIIKDKFNGMINCPLLFNQDMLANESTIKFKNKFDFVIGNPPWVDVKKLPTEKKSFIQKKYNTSNLYSAFLLEALNITNSKGTICFILPRSFTGGSYFSKVRAILKKDCSINSLYYIQNRNQKFHGGKILQEIVVPCFTKNKKNKLIKCFPISEVGEASNSFQIAQKEIYSQHDNILLLAKSFDELIWLNGILKLKNFDKHGFQFSTGQLVPHRAKDFLRNKKNKKAYPIIYAHNIAKNKNQAAVNMIGEIVKEKPPFSVTDGMANFDGRNKNKKPTQESLRKWLHSSSEIILMRRKSHKGDKKRFTGAYCSGDLPKKYFLDNSLNYIINSHKKPNSLPLNAFFKILSSEIFERFFEIVSSNTQVNKNDMYLFGMPELTPKNSNIVNKLVKTKTNKINKTNELVKALYEL